MISEEGLSEFVDLQHTNAQSRRDEFKKQEETDYRQAEKAQDDMDKMQAKLTKRLN